MRIFVCALVALVTAFSFAQSVETKWGREPLKSVGRYLFMGEDTSYFYFVRRLPYKGEFYMDKYDKNSFKLLISGQFKERYEKGLKENIEQFIFTREGIIVISKVWVKNNLAVTARMFNKDCKEVGEPKLILEIQNPTPYTPYVCTVSPDTSKILIMLQSQNSKTKETVMNVKIIDHQLNEILTYSESAHAQRGFLYSFTLSEPSINNNGDFCFVGSLFEEGQSVNRSEVTIHHFSKSEAKKFPVITNHGLERSVPIDLYYTADGSLNGCAILYKTEKDGRIGQLRKSDKVIFLKYDTKTKNLLFKKEVDFGKEIAKDTRLMAWCKDEPVISSESVFGARFFHTEDGGTVIVKTGIASAFSYYRLNAIKLNSQGDFQWFQVIPKESRLEILDVPSELRDKDIDQHFFIGCDVIDHNKNTYFIFNDASDNFLESLPQKHVALKKYSQMDPIAIIIDSKGHIKKEHIFNSEPGTKMLGGGFPRVINSDEFLYIGIDSKVPRLCILSIK